MMKKLLLIPVLLISFLLLMDSAAYAGMVRDFDPPETDTSDDTLVFFFDLRDRETFIQLTNTDLPLNGPDVVMSNFTPGVDVTVHIQVFDVSNNCNENDFFDVYTPKDTHIYNMRDIQTNDGNPAGFILPDGAYGFVFALVIAPDGIEGEPAGSIWANAEILIGNLRIIDNSGYEYRTNGQSENAFDPEDPPNERYATFNYNTSGGITLSDIVGVAYEDDGDAGEAIVDDILDDDNFAVINIDIFDLNENIFSCRDVIFACVNENSTLLDQLIEEANNETDGSASVARAEYGINEAIPHSKGGELLCPGNNISQGIVRMENLQNTMDDPDDFAVWIGLNNGNGRGSMDSLWYETIEEFDSAP